MFLTKKGSLDVEVEMGRQILGMLLTMYLPTTLMNIIGKTLTVYLLSENLTTKLCSRPYYKLHEEIFFRGSGISAIIEGPDVTPCNLCRLA